MSADEPSNEEIITLFKQKPLKKIAGERFQAEEAEKYVETGDIDEAMNEIWLAGFVEAAKQKLGL